MRPRPRAGGSALSSEPGALLCIIPGPTELLRRVPDGGRVIINRTILLEPWSTLRWCFGCRQHLPHDWFLLGDKEPSYYDPVWVRKCSGCGEDRTHFPGREPA